MGNVPIAYASLAPRLLSAEKVLPGNPRQERTNYRCFD